MLKSNLICSILFYYIILYYIILYYNVLYYIVLHDIILYCIILYNTTLCYIILYFIDTVHFDRLTLQICQAPPTPRGKTVTWMMIYAADSILVWRTISKT